ncbi:MAG: putative pyridoxal-dependent aspartate 1-decarboxylase [Deltaproteobacteria bacterium]|nr:MAG: putative pyridoxal-dependent aspartate 1-decarboxylase [Deltaproteobacteria bacterium]
MKQTSKTSKETEFAHGWETLKLIFRRPENDATRSVLLKHMEQILFGLHDFINRYVGITEKISLKELSDRFTDTIVKKNPEKKLEDVITDLIVDIAPHAVNVASPYFVGHMTSAIPFFMVHLKTIITALNQNVVKLETSKVVSVVEKQVLAKIHRLIYQYSDKFYEMHVQNTNTTLGCFVDDGTLANITALWVARNSLLQPKADFEGVEKEGIQAAYKAYGIDRCVVLVSRLGHFSLRKAGGLLGIGNKNIIGIDVDDKNKIDLNILKDTIKKIKRESSGNTIMAVVGIAGTTETGTVDPLTEIAEICKKNRIHFHVDAAWGGPILLSEKYKKLLKGIELADSVTIDGHKQFYMPMSCGMVYFKNPLVMDMIAYYASYVNRPGSLDLGIKSIAGSREATSLILDSTLKIMGRQGYALLIEHGIETAKIFAKEIERRKNFELLTPPELNILTYRICPFHIRQQLLKSDTDKEISINKRLNEINRTVQRLQREAGKSFVSRTTLMSSGKFKKNIVVFRCVIMNPLTGIEILKTILDEQENIFKRTFLD